MLVKWGGGIVDGRGSIGGTTFSRNKSGAIARARVAPVNPKSVRQSAIRAIISSVAQLYNSGLTVAQRAAWAVYAKNVPAKNKLGEVIYLSGYNQFVKSNIAALNAGLTAILAAPSVFSLPGEDTTFDVAISEASQEIAVTFDATADWAGEAGGALIVEMGLPQSPSIEFFDGPWRHAGIIAGDATTPPTTGDSIAVPFPVVADQKIFCRAKVLRADGRLSDWFRSNAIGGA